MDTDSFLYEIETILKIESNFKIDKITYSKW